VNAEGIKEEEKHKPEEVDKHENLRHSTESTKTILQESQAYGGNG